MKHTFDTELAAVHGIEAAILVYNIEFWIQKNQANQRHFYDGRYWTYNSVKAWKDLFPYMTESVIRKRLDYLVDQGLLIRGYFSPDKRDRTSWFSVNTDNMHLSVETNAIEAGDKCSIYTDSKHTDTTESKDSVSKKPFNSDALELSNELEKKPTLAEIKKSCYQEFVRVWCEAYPELGFDGVSGAKIKSLINRSVEIVKLNSGELTEQKINGVFQYILNYVKSSNHWAHGKSITVFDAKYREIYREIKEGRPKNVNAAPSSQVFGRYSNLR